MRGVCGARPPPWRAKPEPVFGAATPVVLRLAGELAEKIRRARGRARPSGSRLREQLRRTLRGCEEAPQLPC